MKWVSKLEGEPYFRMMTPKWAIAPTSGAGAAKNGGRFNRSGIHALYLADEPLTAIAEYQQDQSLMPPGTFVAYEVVLGPVVDFGHGYQHGEWDDLWEDWNCEWRKLVLEGTEPPTWLMADLAIEQGAKGILFPSLRRTGGLNLVIFTAQLGPEDVLRAHDPRGTLPTDQSSWTEIDDFLKGE
jgi:RES domain-containing protein